MRLQWYDISVKKTEVVHQPKPTPKQKKGVIQQQPIHKFPSIPITVDGKSLKYVRSFEYLGSKVNYCASLDDEIVNRISKASNAFRKLRHRLWNERGVSIQTKVSIYRAVVLTSSDVYRTFEPIICVYMYIYIYIFF